MLYIKARKTFINTEEVIASRYGSKARFIFKEVENVVRLCYFLDGTKAKPTGDNPFTCAMASFSRSMDRERDH